MSEYNEVIAGKLRLKGKGALDVKSCGVTKKKKHKKHHAKLFTGNNYSTGMNVADGEKEQYGGGDDADDERLTAAEKRYIEQWQKLEMQRLAKNAAKSHRDRIQELNQYLANLTEHYDIPKVGPG